MLWIIWWSLLSFPIFVSTYFFLSFFFMMLRCVQVASMSPSLHSVERLSAQHKANKEIVERERLQWFLLNIIGVFKGSWITPRERWKANKAGAEISGRQAFTLYSQRPCKYTSPVVGSDRVQILGVLKQIFQSTVLWVFLLLPTFCFYSQYLCFLLLTLEEHSGPFFLHTQSAAFKVIHLF